MSLFFIAIIHFCDLLARLDALEIIVMITRNLKVIWKQLCRCHSRRECTHLLCVLLTVQCLLQMSPVTQSLVRYIHTTLPHSSYTLRLHCAVRFLSSKKICPFQLGIPTPTIKKVIHRLARPTTANDIIGIHTLNLIAIIYVR